LIENVTILFVQPAPMRMTSCQTFGRKLTWRSTGQPASSDPEGEPLITRESLANVLEGTRT
jgi:hypothetical protein